MFSDLISQKPLPLTIKHQKALREQVVDDGQPGTILQNVTTMLEFIGTADQPVTNTNKWLTAKSLRPLNDQMIHPLRLMNTTRPLQQSYSNIHGLYMVLRCSGLMVIRKNKSKTVLAIDEQMHETWMTLNPTERYFSLLEAWLLRGNDEVINCQTGAFPDLSPLHKISRFFQALPTGGADAINFRGFDDNVRFNIGLHNMALLEMFGLTTIQQDTSKSAKGWVIKKLIPTPFGDALFRLLTQVESTSGRNQPANDTTPGFQPVVQPLLPECKNILTIPVHEFKEGVYIFTVSLGKSWRRIAIAGNMMFEELSSAILQAFGFDHSHLYKFRVRNPMGIEQHIDHPFIDGDAPTTTEVAIGDVPLAPGSTMIYHYDFGDDWEFEVLLDGVHPPDPKLKKPKILEQHGKAPRQYSRW